MDVIELECPHCGDALELDAAFAGGVCRCSTCGTLMTVPADPSRGRAETVTRRDRPDAPTSRPETPSSRPEAPGPRPARPEAPVAGASGARAESPGSAADLAALANAAPPGSSAAGPGVYQTASGQSLELAEAVVPTARKRKKVIRATVIGGFVAMVIGVIAIIVIAIMFVMNAGKPTDNGTTGATLDPAVNPLKKPDPNLITVPITGECAIIIDGTNFARQWYPMMRDIIGHQVSLATSTNFMVIPWTDLNPKAFPAKPEKIGRDRISELDAFLGVSNVGTANPVPFIELALAERAKQIVLITGRSLDEAEFKALTEAVAKRVDVHLDVIVVGDHDANLQQMSKNHKGKYVSVKADQLQTWFDEWKKGG